MECWCVEKGKALFLFCQRIRDVASCDAARKGRLISPKTSFLVSSLLTLVSLRLSMHPQWAGLRRKGRTQVKETWTQFKRLETKPVWHRTSNQETPPKWDLLRPRMRCQDTGSKQQRRASRVQQRRWVCETLLNLKYAPKFACRASEPVELAFPALRPPSVQLWRQKV